MDVHQNARLTPRGRQELLDYVLERGARFREAGVRPSKTGEQRVRISLKAPRDAA